MKRSELYKMVWEKPVSKLSAELGISDVGLAKACRRQAIPVPPRGYWAKLQAGKRPPKIALPAPELDTIVDFATNDPEARATQRSLRDQRESATRAEIENAVREVEVVMPALLERPHPLVVATKRLVDRTPKLIAALARRRLGEWSRLAEKENPPHDEHGRYMLFREGVLNITASLESMEWILRFHDGLLKALKAAGMKTEWAKGESGRRAGSGHANRVQLVMGGERFAMEFVQGYHRKKLPASEYAKLRKEKSWASEYVYEPADRFSLRVKGTEYSASKIWEATGQKLQDQLREITHGILALVPLQRISRREREAREEESRKRAEEEARVRRRLQAREEVFKQALSIAEMHEKIARLREFLDGLSVRCNEFVEPYNERVAVWIRVVREELERTDPVHAQLQASVDGPRWRPWPPEWWPEDGDLPESSEGQSLEGRDLI